MNNENLKKGKKFSKDYQPPNENKRKPKWKKRLKQMIELEFDPMIIRMIERIKENGDPKAFNALMDRAFGKVEQNKNLKHDVNGSINVLLQDAFFKGDE